MVNISTSTPSGHNSICLAFIINLNQRWVTGIWWTGGRWNQKNMCLWIDQLSIVPTDLTLIVECCHKRLVWLCKLAIWQINNFSSLARLHLISLLITGWLLFVCPPATSQHFPHCLQSPVKLCRKCAVYFPRRLKARAISTILISTSRVHFLSASAPLSLHCPWASLNL